MTYFTRIHFGVNLANRLKKAQLTFNRISATMQVMITILIKTTTHFPPIFKYAVETFFIDFSRIVIKADGREKKALVSSV